MFSLLNAIMQRLLYYTAIIASYVDKKTLSHDPVTEFYLLIFYLLFLCLFPYYYCYFCISYREFSFSTFIDMKFHTIGQKGFVSLCYFHPIKLHTVLVVR